MRWYSNMLIKWAYTLPPSPTIYCVPPSYLLLSAVRTRQAADNDVEWSAFLRKCWFIAFCDHAFDNFQNMITNAGHCVRCCDSPNITLFVCLPACWLTLCESLPHFPHSPFYYCIGIIGEICGLWVQEVDGGGDKWEGIADSNYFGSYCVLSWFSWSTTHSLVISSAREKRLGKRRVVIYGTTDTLGG